MRWIRLASHIHSSWSDDSSWTLPRLVVQLRRAGFQGALISDHDRTMTDDRWQRAQQECAAVGRATGFLLVPGVEYQDPDHVTHVPVFGAAPFYGRSPDTGDLLRAAHTDGAATVFAHPARRDAWERFNAAWAPNLSGIEVWNRKYDGITPNTWAVRTATTYGLNSFVSLDFHGRRQLYPLAMRVQSDARMTSADVVKALRNGDCRASAWGLTPERLSSGALGRVNRGLEALRLVTAPALRRLGDAAGGHGHDEH
jgi:predicted metal-dependent phosphoesterase TrpH